MDDKFHPQIYDFGLARSVEATVTGPVALHHNYAAPKLFVYTDDDTPYSENLTARTQESDIYAFGSLYYEVSNILGLLWKTAGTNCADPLRCYPF